MTGQQQGYGDLTEYLVAQASAADLHYVLAAVLTELDRRHAPDALIEDDRGWPPPIFTEWATVRRDPDGPWQVAWDSEASYTAAANTDREAAGTGRVTSSTVTRPIGGGAE